MKVEKDFTIFAASPSDNDSIEAAMRYIGQNNLTSEDAGIYRSLSTISVITKKQVEIIV